ncbi:hypothetical protein FRC08_017239 [Ceratobasidium sp. 394]|nr:hypothetical protein FRC08_017239 [Ceratobasidium sp. 394]
MGWTTASRPGGEGEDATDVPRLRLEAAAMQRAPGEQVQHVHASGSAAPGMDRIEGRGNVPCSPSRAADPTSERDRDPARLASNVWNLSADHNFLEYQLARLEGINPGILSGFSSGDIKAILQELVKDRRNSRNRQTSDTQCRDLFWLWVLGSRSGRSVF